MCYSLQRDVLTFLFLGLFCVVSAIGCEGLSKEEPLTQKIKKVEVFSVQPVTFQETIVASALASAYREHRMSTEIPGMLKRKHVDGGARVKKNTILFEIDAEIFQLHLRESVAIMEKSEARLRFIRAEVKRKKPLFQAKTFSQSGWEQLQFDLVSALSERDLARVAFERSKRDLRLAVMKSPIDGILLEGEHDVGEVVPVGTVLARVLDTTRITFEVGVSDLELRYLRPEDPVSVSIDAFPDRHFEGKITQISGSASSEKGIFPVEVTLDNSDGEILSGMVGRLTLFGENNEDQIIIPMKAVHQQGGAASVFLFEKNHVSRRPIRTGKVLGDRIIVLEGLSSGDQIVLIAQGRLRSGERVEVIE